MAASAGAAFGAVEAVTDAGAALAGPVVVCSRTQPASRQSAPSRAKARDEGCCLVRMVEAYRLAVDLSGPHLFAAARRLPAAGTIRPAQRSIPAVAEPGAES